MNPKWHYYNSKDILCLFEHPFKPERKVRRTYCRRDPFKVLHTDFKNEVSCLLCLKMINAFTQKKEKDREGNPTI